MHLVLDKSKAQPSPKKERNALTNGIRKPDLERYLLLNSRTDASENKALATLAECGLLIHRVKLFKTMILLSLTPKIGKNCVNYFVFEKP